MRLTKFLAASFAALAILASGCSKGPAGLSVKDKWQQTEVNSKEVRYKLFPGTVGSESGYLEIVDLGDHRAALRIFRGEEPLSKPQYFHVRLVQNGYSMTSHAELKDGYLIDDSSLSCNVMEPHFYQWLCNLSGKPITIDGYANSTPGYFENEKRTPADFTFKFENLDLSGITQQP